MKTYNISITAIEELTAKLDKITIKDNQSLLIQVFSGILDRVFIDTLRSSLKGRYPNAAMIGSTTDGEISDGEVTTEHCVISLTQFKSVIPKVASVSGSDPYAMGREIASAFSGDLSKVFILFGSGIGLDGEAIIRGVQEINPLVIVAGGISGDNALFHSPYAFTYDAFVENGVVGVALGSEQLRIITDYSYGWEVLGRQMFVTRAEGNHLYELDGISVVDMYSRYFGKDIADKILHSQGEFPLVIEREGMPVARALFTLKEDGSVMLSGSICVGDLVRFGFGNPEMILDPTKMISQRIEEEVESIFVYSCMGRRRFMPDQIQNEIIPLQSLAPTSGFFTYGEFFHLPNSNELLNQTMTVIAMSESEKKLRTHSVLPYQSESGFGKTLKSLITFANSTLEEMEKLNESLEEKVLERTRELQELNEKLEKRVALEVKQNRDKDQMLFEQARMASMGEMISSIAHQWRQPLNALSLTIANVSDAYTFKKLDDEKMEKFTEKSHRLIQKMSSTIDDFRNFFVADKEKKRFSPSSVIHESIALIDATLKYHGIELEINIGSEAEIDGFPGEFSQAVLNLVSNARDALIERAVMYPKIIITENTAHDEMVITVSDNAGGIPPEVLPKIFNPYFTTKEQGKGTGIGLYMTKTIIEEHMNGKITAVNTEEGACFIMKIPLKEQ